MTTWCRRPRDEAHLFNPAFGGLVLYEAIAGFSKEDPAGMPFALSYLTLPIVLHKKTRDELPKRFAPGNMIAPWLVNHPEAKIGFDHRVRVMADISRESLLFLFRAQAIRVGNSARLLQTDLKLPSRKGLIDESADIEACIKASVFTGRWLANAGPPHNVFALWGIRP